MKKVRSILLLLVIMLFCAPTWAEPTASDPDASITFEVTSIAAGVGGSSGSGILNYKGYEIPFNMSGLSALEAGIAKKKGRGFVYGLKNLSDFNGSYSAQTGGVALLSGVGYQRLNKENDSSNVFVELKSTEKGLNLGFTTGRVKMTLDKAAMKRTLAALNAPGEKHALKSVYFDLNSAKVREADKPKLQELVMALRNGPASEVVITGFTDASGTREQNIELSRSRAENVYSELQHLAQQKGVAKVPKPRIEVRGEGEAGSGPESEVNQALRRVDVAVAYNIPPDTVYR